MTDGKPDGILQAFLEWVRTDGQVYVERSGYVKLTDEQLGISLEKNR